MPPPKCLFAKMLRDFLTQHGEVKDQLVVAAKHPVFQEKLIPNRMFARRGIRYAHIPDACLLNIQHLACWVCPVHVKRAEGIEVNLMAVEGHAPLGIFPGEFHGFLRTFHPAGGNPELCLRGGDCACAVENHLLLSAEFMQNIWSLTIFPFVDEFHIPDFVPWLDPRPGKLTRRRQNSQQDQPDDERIFFMGYSK